MRFGVIGLGSMGKRRVRDLRALGHEVIGFDLREDRMRQSEELYGVRTVPSYDALVAADVQALSISTPPDQHVEYYERAFASKLPFFCEANVLTPRPEWFAEHEAASGVRTYPSGTFRFHGLFSLLKEHLDGIGLDRVRTVHARYAGYLPSWHPWERYDEFYAGRQRETCAVREMVPFELEWLCYVFGPVRSVCAVRASRAEWTTDIDDTYLLQLEFDSGAFGTLSVELHQVAPFRTGRVSCENQSFALDLTVPEMRRYDRETDTWRVLKPKGTRALGTYDWEHAYLEEMAAFVDDLEGRGQYPKSWSDDRHLSDVLAAAEESWRRRAWVDVREAAESYDGHTLATL